MPVQLAIGLSLLIPIGLALVMLSRREEKSAEELNAQADRLIEQARKCKQSGRGGNRHGH